MRLAVAAVWLAAGLAAVPPVRGLDSQPPANSPPSLLKDSAVDSDGDGMPDEWESDNGLNPASAEGDDGWYGDPDRDGLINGYEFLSTQAFAPATLRLLDPLDFDSDGDGIGDYYDRFAWDQLQYGETLDDADLLPDLWETMHGSPWGWPTTLSPLLFSAYSDEDFDGWSNLDEFIYRAESGGEVVRGTDPSDPASHPVPKVAGRLAYNGSATGACHVLAYRTPSMDGWPLAHVVLGGPATAFEIHDVPKGPVYLFAYIGGEVPDRASPWGVPRKTPLNVGWSGIEGETIGLNDPDERPYYPLFSWAPKQGATRYKVTILDSVGNVVLNKWINAPRNWFMHCDYETATYRPAGRFHGLPAGTYTYKVRAEDGTLVAGKRLYVRTQAVVAPTPVTPPNGSVVRQVNLDLVVGNLVPAATFDLRVTLPSGVITNFGFHSQWREPGGICSLRLPVLLGDGAFANGLYSWDIRAFNGIRWTAYSKPKRTFTVAIGTDPTAAPWLGGVVLYHGRVPTNLVVEAFAAPDFAGTPQARRTIASPRSANHFALHGLSHRPYSVMAYLDENTNLVADAWESQAIARAPEYGENYEHWDDYGVGVFDLAGASSASNVVVVVRDRDTDEDRMPDAWEMRHFGSLVRDGGDDFDGDGVSDLHEYARGTNPGMPDSDGDGVPDSLETGP
jgi:hypothetical protein